MQLNLYQITHDIFHRTLEKIPQNFRTNNPKTYMEAQKVQNYIQMANKTNEKVLNSTKVQSEVTQSCPMLQPMDYMVCQAPLSMGFSKLEYWTGLPFPSPGITLTQRSNPGLPHCQADSLPSEPPGIL